MTQISEMRPGPLDMYRGLGMNVVHQAYDRGMNLSAFLETEMQAPDANEPLDAFQRIIEAAGIRTSGVPALGIQADTWEKFNATPALRILAMEWAARKWRSVVHNRPYHTRDLWASANLPNSVQNPAYYEAAARYQVTTPAIPISELVAFSLGIRNNTYKAYYLTTPTAATVRMGRVEEFADIPTSTLAGGDHTITLYKTGRGIKQSYEAMRYQPIDMVAIWIEYLAAQSEADKLTAVIDILVSGDGNTGTAATNYNLTALDAAAVAGTLTLKGWLAYKMKFTNPLMLTHILVQEAVALQLALLNMGNANVPLVSIQAASGFGSLTAINSQLGDNVRFGYTSDAPSLKIVGLDRRTALLRVYDIAGNIQEVERYASNQSQGLYMTETEAFCCLIPGSNITLNVNA